jgi:hypothetical protein
MARAKLETVSGSTQLRHGETDKSESGWKIPYEYVEAWDYRIRQDLDFLISGPHQIWTAAQQYVRNTGAGQKQGNLVSEFIKTLHSRLLAKELNVHVESDNPGFADDAEKAEVVSQSVQRIADLIGALREASNPATWASFGVLEVGHPIDPSSNDPWMSFRAPNYTDDNPSAADRWEEIDPEELQTWGADPDKVVPFSEQSRLELARVLEGNGMPGSEVPEQPRPVFRPSVGYPWIQSVDPRLIVFPTNAKNDKRMSYVARLRFITRAELKTVQGYDVGAGMHVNGHYRGLFEYSEEDGGLDLYPEMCLIVEVYIKRDRNNPAYNNWYFSYILGEPGRVIRHGPNQNGGMTPFIFLKLDPLKHMFDPPLATELIRYADLYDLGLQSIMETMKEMLNKKDYIEHGAGLTEPEERKLYNPDYRGPVRLQSVSSIKQREAPTINMDLIRTLEFTKSLAQSTTAQSDIDRGQAIKEITARQTQALLDATGINIKTMAAAMSVAARECVMKLMHLAGIYSMVGRDRKFQFGGKFTSMQRGSHDFTTSYIYNVKVEDAETGYTAEDRLLWTQFIRILFSDTSGFLVPFFDREGLAKHTRRVFDAPMSMLASRAAGREGSGFDPSQMMQEDPGVSGSLGGPIDGQAGNMLQDQGQHPERAPGSRGLGVSNALTGAFKTGTGTGEM